MVLITSASQLLKTHSIEFDLKPVHLNIDSMASLLYRGEGNSSLVVALKMEHKVIRLLKADAKQLQNDIKSSSSLSSDSSSIQHEVTAILDHHLAFNLNVIPLILNPMFVDCPNLVQLDQEQVDMINQLVQDKRPSFRLDKKIINGETLALLLPDYCCLPKQLSQLPTQGPMISVEIKPKQGFLPKIDCLPLELQIKSEICRYCLSQFRKLNKSSINSISTYCPLDLFSGCPNRMMNSLMSLLSNPQNNLRIFRDIQLEYGENNTPNDLEMILNGFINNDNRVNHELNNNLKEEQEENNLIIRFCKLIYQALIMPFTEQEYNQSQHNQQQQEQQNNQQQQDQSNNNSNQLSKVLIENYYCKKYGNSQMELCQCNTKDHYFPKGCVLETILSAQKLDTIDSSLANQMFQFLSNDNNPNAQDEDVISELISSIVPDGYLQVDKRENESQNDYYLRKVWQFLVSLTAKDCSIMITMQRIDDELIYSSSSILSSIQNIIKDSISGHNYLVSIAITDLDQKSPSKLARTLSNDFRMVNAYCQHNCN